MDYSRASPGAVTSVAPLRQSLLTALGSRPFSTDELFGLPSIRDASGRNIGKVAQELGALSQQGLVGRQSRNWNLTAKGRAAIRAGSAQPRPANGNGSTESTKSSSVTTRPATGGEAPPPVSMEYGNHAVPQMEHEKRTCRWTEPWHPFHKLLSYYIRCVEEDERPGLNCLFEDKGKTWLPLPNIREWSTSGEPQLTLLLSPWMSEFFRLAAQKTDPVEFYYGYPVEAFSWINKDDASLRTFLTPAILQPISIATETGRLVVRMRDEPRINERWLEDHFYKENKDAVLHAVRGIPNQGTATLAKIVEALAPFLRSERVIQQPNPQHVTPLPSNYESEANGLRNAAILISTKKLKYNRGLLAELRWIRDHAAEEDLDKTALHAFFRIGESGKSETEKKSEENPRGERGEFRASVRYQSASLNAEQRSAVQLTFTGQAALILGPPGTGKTDVGVGIAVQHYLNERSVLFCSRNHAAVREFSSRCNSIPGCPQLVVQPGEDGQPATYAEAVIQVLGELSPETMRKDEQSAELHRLQSDAERISDSLSDLERVLRLHSEEHRCAVAARSRIERLSGKIPPDVAQACGEHRFPLSEASRIASCSEAVNHARFLFEQSSFSSRVAATICALRLGVVTNRDSKRLAKAIGLPARPSLLAAKEMLSWLGTASLTADFGLAKAEFSRAESALANAIPIDQLAASWQEQESRLIETTRKLLPEFFGSRFNRLSAVALADLLSLQPILRSKDGRGLGEKMKGAIQRKVQSAFPACLHVLPIWAVTNLSLRRCVPLAAAAFDLAVIDEASQCDIPSAIPVLFRAKRITIVGDRFQLPHTTRLPLERDGVIFGETGLEDVESLIFRYASNSLYDLADYRLNKCAIGRKIMLREHYRCHEEIINFCSDTFYPEPLRVRTDAARLRVPAGRKAGIHWTHISGKIERGTDGGCRSRDEAEACVSEIVGLIRDRGFAGTIGVVTPFRAQKLLVRQLIEQSLTAAEISRCPILADTAHGFQGGQRDVVLMSLVLGPDMPDGSKYFLNEGKNLFNVAVSRAAGVLHVVGNLDFAEECGIEHVVKFARYFKAKQSRDELRSKPPVPDKWENRLRDLLLDAGIQTVQQHPVDGRFLDLAYIDRGVKIDIEVDGVATHMTEAGNRVHDDFWRDLRLQAQGWHIVRFWVCQVRDEPEKCVTRIKSAINALTKAAKK